MFFYGQIPGFKFLLDQNFHNKLINLIFGRVQNFKKTNIIYSSVIVEKKYVLFLKPYTVSIICIKQYRITVIFEQYLWQIQLISTLVKCKKWFIFTAVESRMLTRLLRRTVFFEQLVLDAQISLFGIVVKPLIQGELFLFIFLIIFGRKKKEILNLEKDKIIN